MIEQVCPDCGADLPVNHVRDCPVVAKRCDGRFTGKDGSAWWCVCGHRLLEHYPVRIGVRVCGPCHRRENDPA